MKKCTSQSILCPPKPGNIFIINTKTRKGTASMNKPLAAAAVIIAVIALTAGIVLSSFMLSRFMLKIQHSTEKSITVKGVAEKLITSDLAAFKCSITVKGISREEGYANLARAQKTLLAKLDSLGFNAAMREDENISCDAHYRTVKTKDKYGKETSNSYFDHYELTYSVRIRTNNVKLVSANVLKIHELAYQKLNVSVDSPSYFINNPEQYKLELVNSASASAAQRARTAASHSGSALGPLMEARQGVIQITAPASNETSDYGVYDTKSVQKVIRLVMTMKFALQ